MEDLLIDSPSRSFISGEMQKKTDKIKVLELPIKSGMIVLMDHPSAFTVNTYVAIQVLSGSVSVLGYEITPNEEEPVEVFSSEKTGLIEIKTETYEHIWKKNGTNADLEELILDFTQDSLKTSLLLSNLGARTVAIFFQQVAHPINLQFVELYYPFLFDFNSGKKKRADIYLENGTPIQFGQNEEKLASEISKCIRNAKLADTDAPRILVCGCKGTGKSTLIRYLVNKILSVYKVAYYLDTDTGQTEFTPPGVVSLTQVTKPIFGPSFCHQRKPFSMIFTGSIHPICVDDYSKSVNGLMNIYNRKYRDEPLFVNTMGWMEGLGLECLKNIIGIIKPTILIEIEAEENSSMFDYREYVQSNCQYYQICQSFNKPTKSYSPKQHREFSLLSYFGKPKCQSPFIGPVLINEVRPYCVSWDDMALFHFNHVLEPQRLVEAMNLSIVALCAVPESLIVESIPFNQRTLQAATENTCLGFGLVRAVDETEHILYIVTPLRSGELERVNAIIKGNVMIPDAVILAQKIYHEPLPYTAVRDVVPNVNDEEMQDISVVSVPSASDMETSSPQPSLSGASIKCYRKKIPYRTKMRK